MQFLSSSPQCPTPLLRKKAEQEAILSACTGATGEITLTDSAVIILFASVLGAGDMFSMLTTAMQHLMNGLFIIPMACLVPRVGTKGLIIRVCTLAFLCYLILVCAPFFGQAAVPVMLISLFCFSILQTGCAAGWVPLMDSFLLPERRGSFLGKMRFSWQLTTAVFLFLAGLFLGSNPPASHLQAILLIGAVSYFCRVLFVSRIPVFSSPAHQEAADICTSLQIALRNRTLVGFSIYLFAFNLAAFGTIPLTTLYMRNQLHAPHNIIVILSSITLCGMLTGSLAAGKLLQKYRIKKVIIGIHIIYLLINSALFLISPDLLPAKLHFCIIGVLLFIYSFCYADYNISTTSGMMALATPGNKAMAIAFCGAFYYLASGFSRMLSSLILGSGMLAAEWNWNSWHFCRYQTFYLFYATELLFAALFLLLIPGELQKK